MDELDVRILRELVQGQAIAPLDPNFRKSFGAIARKLSVDQDTVRNRIRRLHKTGFIRGWRTIVNPNLLRRGELALWFDMDPSVKDDLVEKLRLMPGMVVIVRYHGTFLTLIFRYYDEWAARKQIELIRKLADVDRVSVARVPFPECNIALSKTDWATLRALYADPRKRLTAIAKELGISGRTVRRKLERLAREAALFAFPALNPKALQGGVMAQLFVAYRVDRKQEVDRRIATGLDRHLWHILHMAPFEPSDVTWCAYNLAVQNIAETHEVLRWARGVPGVLEARLELYEDIDTHFEVYDEEMESRIGELLGGTETPHPTARA